MTLRRAERSLFALCLAAAVLAAVGTQADDSSCLPEAARWPYGPTDQIAASSPHLFYNSGTVLKIAELSDPAQPRVTGELVFDSPIIDIAAGPGLAYVATINRGLSVVDIDHPTGPALTARLDIRGVTHLEATGHLIFAAEASEGLWIVDAGDPYHPNAVSLYEPAPGIGSPYPQIEALEVVDDRAYLSTSAFDLVILDVSSPSAPVRLSAFDHPDLRWHTDVQISDGVAYVGDAREVLILDITDERNPNIVGWYDHPKLNNRFEIDNGILFSVGSYLLHLFDLSDPTAPHYFAHSLGGHESRDVVVVDGWVYVAARGYGVEVIDARNPSSLVILGSTGSPGHSYDTTFVEPYVYVAKGEHGLSVVDVSSPLQPLEVGSLAFSGSALDLAVNGTTVFVAVRHDGLRIVDAASPDNPTGIGFLPLTGGARQVELSGDHAYVSDDEPRLKVIDVSTPTEPVEVASASCSHLVSDIEIAGDRAYVATAEYLDIFDISDPEFPQAIGNMYVWGGIERVAVRGELVFGLLLDMVSVIDVSDPSQPEVIGWFRTEYTDSSDIEVSGDRLYVPISGTQGPSYGGVNVFDITDPVSPVELGFTTAAGPGKALSVDGELVYLASTAAGLVVIDAASPWMPPTVNQLPTPGRTRFLDAHGNFVVIAETGGLRILELTADEVVDQVSFLERSWAFGDVIVSGQFVFVRHEYGVTTISIEDPYHPSVLSEIELDRSYPASVAMVDPSTLLVAEDHQFLLFDVSDRWQPIELSSYPIPYVRDWPPTVIGGMVYIHQPSYGHDDISIVDVSDPASPQLITTFAAEGHVDDVLVGESFAYLAMSLAETSELKVLDVTDPANPVPVGDIESTLPYEIDLISASDRRLLCTQDDARWAWLIEAPASSTPVVFDVASLDLSGVDYGTSGRFLHVAKGDFGFVTYDIGRPCRYTRQSGGRVSP